MTENHANTILNRSEILLLLDANDSNPNGNPASAENRPRMDPQTQQGIITDVRLKRYIRDQLADDGHDIFVKEVDEDGSRFTRTDLFEDIIGAESLEDIPDDPLETFLDAAIDVRYFGATLSLKGNDTVNEFLDELPSNLTGSVQFSPGRTLHPVTLNEEYNSLTSVIATQDGKEQGGFGLNDHRIKYGMYAFNGVVNENATTMLTEDDVERLDSVCWRAIMNQTLTRSKTGQTPRLYMRVEYSDDSYHLGRLDTEVELDESSKPAQELRNIRDLVLNVDNLFELLAENEERIDTIHVNADSRLSLVQNDESFSGSSFEERLAEHLPSANINAVEPTAQ